MERAVLDLPMIIGGREVKGEKKFRLEYDDLIIQFPVLNEDMRKEVNSMDREALHNLRLWEIIGFLQKVSDLWHDEEYPLRKKLLEYAPRVSGMSMEMYKYTIYVLLTFLCCKGFLSDIVDADLGDTRLLDEWVPKIHGEIHAHKPCVYGANNGIRESMGRRHRLQLLEIRQGESRKTAGLNIQAVRICRSHEARHVAMRLRDRQLCTVGICREQP